MNKLVVITGASSGIGKELLKLYIRAGDTAVNVSRTNPDGYEPYVYGDLTDRESIKAAVAEIARRYGKIDVLINNAGIGISGALELLPEDEIERVFAVNLTGTVYMTKYALPLMDRGARIVNISSAAAFFGLPFRGLYCSAKAGVNMLSYSLRAELRPLGIDVTSVCPGDTKSNFTANRLKNFETAERYGDRIKKAAEGIDLKDGKRMPAEIMARKIYKRITRKKTRPDYLIGGKMVFLRFASKFFTRNFFIKMTDKFFGGHGIKPNKTP